MKVARTVWILAKSEEIARDGTGKKLVVDGATVTGDKNTGYTVTQNMFVNELKIETDEKTNIEVVTSGELKKLVIDAENSHISIADGSLVRDTEIIAIGKNSLEVKGQVDLIIVNTNREFNIILPVGYKKDIALFKGENIKNTGNITVKRGSQQEGISLSGTHKNINITENGFTMDDVKEDYAGAIEFEIRDTDGNEIEDFQVKLKHYDAEQDEYITDYAVNGKGNVFYLSKGHYQFSIEAQGYFSTGMTGEFTVDEMKSLVLEVELQKIGTAADFVNKNIEDLPDVDTVTLEDKDRVNAIRNDYNGLSDDQKILVKEELLQKLASLEERIKELEEEKANEENIAKAKEVEDQINALPTVEDLKLEDRAKVSGVRTALDELTEDQKALVSETLVNKLKALEEKLTSLEKDEEEKLARVKTVEEKITNLPSLEELTLENKEEVEEAKVELDKLTEDEKVLVNEELVEKLVALEKRLAELENLANEEAKKEAQEKLNQVLSASKDYKYDPVYNYNYNKFEIVEDTVELEYKDITVENAKVVMDDLARYLGAMYRIDNGETVKSIEYKGQVYTWNGELKGSNWKNETSTLIKAITDDFKENDGLRELNLKLVGDLGVEKTVTIKGKLVTSTTPLEPALKVLEVENTFEISDVKDVRFMVKSITQPGSKEGNTVQKLATLEEVNYHFNNNYEVKNGYKLEVELVENNLVLRTYMTEELFAEIKGKDGANLTTPYKITVLKDNNRNNKILKLAYTKGNVVLEKIEAPVVEPEKIELEVENTFEISDVKDVRFMVKSITQAGSKEGTTVQKLATLEEVNTHFNNNYEVKNGYKLEAELVENSLVLKTYMTEELFAEIKGKDGANLETPYKITVLKDNNRKNKILKLAYTKENVELEEIKAEVPTDPTLAIVGNEVELREAAKNAEIKTIELSNDIVLNEKVDILNEKEVNGNGHTLSGNNDEGWNGLYLLHFYNTKGMVKDLKLQKADAGLLLNGSDVELKNVEIKDMEFGGIELSKGKNVKNNPRITLNDRKFELDGNIPAIWIDKYGEDGLNENLVNYTGPGAFKQSHVIEKDGKKVDQLWFSNDLIADDSIVKFQEPLTLENENIIGDNIRFLVYGLNKGNSGVQKPVILDEIMKHGNDMGITFNIEGIKIDDGKIEILERVLKPSDWKKIKENGDKTIPYRITVLLNDNKANKLGKIAMYEDGLVKIEDSKLELKKQVDGYLVDVKDAEKLIKDYEKLDDSLKNEETDKVVKELNKKLEKINSEVEEFMAEVDEAIATKDEQKAKELLDRYSNKLRYDSKEVIYENKDMFKKLSKLSEVKSDTEEITE